jgi:hypothetical protein
LKRDIEEGYCGDTTKLEYPRVLPSWGAIENVRSSDELTFGLLEVTSLCKSIFYMKSMTVMTRRGPNHAQNSHESELLKHLPENFALALIIKNE